MIDSLREEKRSTVTVDSSRVDLWMVHSIGVDWPVAEDVVVRIGHSTAEEKRRTEDECTCGTVTESLRR